MPNSKLWKDITEAKRTIIALHDVPQLALIGLLRHIERNGGWKIVGPEVTEKMVAEISDYLGVEDYEAKDALEDALAASPSVDEMLEGEQP